MDLPLVPAVPRKWFGSTDCDYIHYLSIHLYTISWSEPFRGTAGICLLVSLKKKKPAGEPREHCLDEVRQDCWNCNLILISLFWLSTWLQCSKILQWRLSNFLVIVLKLCSCRSRSLDFPVLVLGTSSGSSSSNKHLNILFVNFGICLSFWTPSLSPTAKVSKGIIHYCFKWRVILTGSKSYTLLKTFN